MNHMQKNVAMATDVRIVCFLSAFASDDLLRE
jgi:hypothetical protein